MLAQDEGDPAVDVSPRDLVFSLAADDAASPDAVPRQIAATNLRYGGVSWGDDDLALVYESWWKTRRSIVCTFSPAHPDEGLKVIRRTSCSSCTFATALPLEGAFTRGQASVGQVSPWCTPQF